MSSWTERDQHMFEQIRDGGRARSARAGAGERGRQDPSTEEARGAARHSTPRHAAARAREELPVVLRDDRPAVPRSRRARTRR